MLGMRDCRDCTLCVGPGVAVARRGSANPEAVVDYFVPGYLLYGRTALLDADVRELLD